MLPRDTTHLNKDHDTNEEVCAKIQHAVGPHIDLLTTVNRRKLQWYGHVTGERGNKTRQAEEKVGRQHQGMVRTGYHEVPEGNGEQGKMEETACKIICGAPTTLAV